MLVSESALEAHGCLRFHARIRPRKKMILTSTMAIRWRWNLQAGRCSRRSTYYSKVVQQRRDPPKQTIEGREQIIEDREAGGGAPPVHPHLYLYRSPFRPGSHLSRFAPLTGETPRRDAKKTKGLANEPPLAPTDGGVSCWAIGGRAGSREAR